MRLPFRLALAFCALLALLVSFWLFVALLCLFGRAILAGAHRRGSLGGRRDLTVSATGRAQEELPGEAGESARAGRDLFETLPFP